MITSLVGGEANWLGGVERRRRGRRRRKKGSFCRLEEKKRKAQFFCSSFPFSLSLLGSLFYREEK
ncbi:hypothetical protein LINPERHAP2_LOCUS44757, partial [Linum perenne]